MNIDIQSRDFSLTTALRTYIKRRLGFALSTRYDRIKRILVRLSDINGPRGGKDKCCQLQVVLPGQADIVIADTQADMYLAIDRAANRAGRTTSRRLARIHGRKRGRLLADDMQGSSDNTESF
jgi:ribosomal subunit interface protein